VDKNCKLAVKTQGSRVSDVRKLNERDSKMMALVECESQGEAENIIEELQKIAWKSGVP